MPLEFSENLALLASGRDKRRQFVIVDSDSIRKMFMTSARAQTDMFILALGRSLHRIPPDGLLTYRTVSVPNVPRHIIAECQ
jgi:hypothetical protein